MKIGIPVVVNKLFDKFFQNKKCIKLGIANPYYVYPLAIPNNPVVFSGGVGGDISFELDLYRRYKAKISIFDPSPVGEETIKKFKDLPMKFYPVGLSSKNQFVYFQNPKRDGSYGSYPTSKGAKENKFKCVALSAIAKNRKIDLLKLDIEGSEYGVLDDILSHKMEVSQIILEFHHFLKEIPYSYTLKAIAQLKKAGYRLIYKDIDNFTFVKKELL